jgi:hypothetical protein
MYSYYSRRLIYGFSLLKLPDGNIALAINIRNINDSLKCVKSITYEKYSNYNNLILLTDSRMPFTACNSVQFNSIVISNVGDDYNIIKVIDATEDYISCLASQSNILASSLYEDFTIKI